MMQHELSQTLPYPLPAQTPPHTKASLERLEHLQEQLTRRPVRRTATKAWDRFLALPEDFQLAVESSWDSQSLLLESAIRSGIQAQDQKGMLRIALDRLQLDLAPSLLESVTNDDIAEIESWDLIPAYRSLNHFSQGRYSLVELIATPRNDLYSQVGSSDEWTLREKLTEEKLSFRLREKFRARLASAQTGEPFTLVVYSTGSILN